jgi:Uma2 family endonuclease
MTTRQSEALSADRPPLPEGKLTFEEFHDWLTDGTFAEWVDGEVIMMSPSSERHEALVFFLAALVRTFAQERDLGRVYLAPFLMRLYERPSGREPDLLFVSTENAERMKETYVDGPADLVVEVVSPESVSRDRGDKYAEYEQAGVREYWLIDPIRESANFYMLDDEGLYRDAILEEESIFRSKVLAGLWLDVSWLWQKKLPTNRQTVELVDKMLAEIS